MPRTIRALLAALVVAGAVAVSGRASADVGLENTSAVLVDPGLKAAFLDRLGQDIGRTPLPVTKLYFGFAASVTYGFDHYRSRAASGIIRSSTIVSCGIGAYNSWRSA